MELRKAGLPPLRVLRDRRGAALAEYAFLIAFVVLVSIPLLSTIGSELLAKFTAMTSAL